MRTWDEQEENFLIQNYKKLGKFECSRKLHRSISSIFGKAQKMKLCARPVVKAEHKICSSCRCEKPKHQFYKNAGRGDGLNQCCVDCLRKKVNQNRPLYWAKLTIRKHKSRGFIVGFSLQELVTFIAPCDTCQLCGRKLSWTNTKIQDDSPTLDRINNQKSLMLDTIAILCHQCNSTKRNRSIQEFLNYLIHIKPTLELWSTNQ